MFKLFRPTGRFFQNFPKFLHKSRLKWRARKLNRFFLKAISLKKSTSHERFIPVFPLWNDATLGDFEITHGFQKHLIILLAPQHDGAKPGRRCNYVTWSLVNLCVAFLWVSQQDSSRQSFLGTVDGSGTFLRRRFGDNYLAPSCLGAELFWRWAVLDCNENVWKHK